MYFVFYPAHANINILQYAAEPLISIMSICLK